MTYRNPPSGTRMTWQEPAANAAALPLLGNAIGDARVAQDTSTLYVWSGATWVASAGGGGPPTGAAGGDLGATYPNPTVVALEETSGPTRLPIGAVANGQVLARSGAAIIGVTPSSAPSGAAGGDLGATYPNPTVVALEETSGPTRLPIGAVANGQLLARSGAAIVGVAPGGAPSGAAGGDLGATYPNPTVVALEETSGPTRLPIGAVANGQLLARVGAAVVGLAATALGGTGVRSNKGMAASVTTADGDLACATAVATTPAVSSTAGGYFDVRVNGLDVSVGDAAKTSACYVSGDGGTTARAMRAIVAGDLLYWVGSVAGFQLATTDVVDFLYPVTT